MEFCFSICFSGFCFIILCIVIAKWPFWCSICKTPIKKKSYRVKDDDKKILHLCPKCNNKFEKRTSDREFKKWYKGK